MNSLNNYQTYVISMNTPECSVRKPFFMKNIKEAGFNDLHIFDGINVREDTSFKQNCEYFGIDTNKINPGMSRGELGCLMSHVKVWELFISSGKEYGVVFEDDVFFHPNWNILSNVYWEKTPKDFDMLFMGHHVCTRHPADSSPEIVSEPCYCTHAYIITINGAKQLLKSIFNNDLLYAIDMMLVDKYMNTNKIKWYCWNGRKYPCTESENKYYDRNDGLVFQSDMFETVIHY